MPSMRILFSLPVPRSLAETFSTPFASISKVTSICGMPRGAGGMPSKWNVPDELVVVRDRPLALIHLHFDRRLTVGRGGEFLGAFFGIVVFRWIIGVITPPSVSIPSVSGVTSSSSRSDFDPSSSCAPWMAAPTATTSSGIHALVAFLAEDVFHDLLHARHAGHAADQHDFVDLVRLVAGVLQRLRDRPTATLDQVLDHLLEFERVIDMLQVLRPAGVGRDKRQIDVGGRLLRQILLGPLGGFFKPLQRHLVLAQIDAVFLLELIGDPIDQHLVEVVAAQVRVAVGRFDLEQAVAPTSRIEISNVPPPRSKTAIFSSFFFSSP